MEHASVCRTKRLGNKEGCGVAWHLGCDPAARFLRKGGLMKKAVAVTLLFVSLRCAMAQDGLSLPIFDTGVSVAHGSSRLTTGFAAGKESFLAGVRGSVWLIDGLQFFGEAAWLSWDQRGTGPAIQAGTMYTMPLDVPADVAARLTVYKPFADSDRNITGLTCSLVAGRDLEAILLGVSIYCVLGVDFQWMTLDLAGGTSDRSDEINPMLAAGVQWRLLDSMAVYIEGLLEDTLFGCVGVGADF